MAVSRLIPQATAVAIKVFISLLVVRSIMCDIRAWLSCLISHPYSSKSRIVINTESVKCFSSSVSSGGCCFFVSWLFTMSYR